MVCSQSSSLKPCIPSLCVVCLFLIFFFLLLSLRTGTPGSERQGSFTSPTSERKLGPPISSSVTREW